MISLTISYRDKGAKMELEVEAEAEIKNNGFDGDYIVIEGEKEGIEFTVMLDRNEAKRIVGIVAGKEGEHERGD